MPDLAWDPYDWLLESYIWRFSTARQQELRVPQEGALQAVQRIVAGILHCAERCGEEPRRRREFREIAYRVVNNVRRIQEQIGDDPAGVAAGLQLLVKDFEIVDPWQRGLADVVDWSASDVSSSGLSGRGGTPEHHLTLVVQRQLDDVLGRAEVGRFLQESFIAPPDWIEWTCAGERLACRPTPEGAAGSRSGTLSVGFTQTRWYTGPTRYSHRYRYDMTWDAGAYRFDFELIPGTDDSPAFSLDRGFVEGRKRPGHPGETVISVQREAWLRAYQHFNVFMPVVLRIQMFDALCVWLKDLGDAE